MKIKKLFHQLTKKEYQMYGIGLSLLVFLLLLFLASKAIFFILGFMLVNIVIGLVLIPLRSILFTVSLSLFAGVLCGMAYGGKVGFFAAVLTSIPKMIAHGEITPYTFPVVLSYGIAGGLSGFFMGWGVEGIVVVGIIMTLFHNIFSSIIVLFMGGGWGKRIISLIVGIPFNLLLFYFIGPFFLKLML